MSRGDVQDLHQKLERARAARLNIPGTEIPADERKALKGLDLNALGSEKYENCNALHLAAKICQVEQARLLLREVPGVGAAGESALGVDPSTVDNTGWTALHFAARNLSPPYCTTVVEELLHHRADPCMATEGDATPLDLARRSQCSSCVRALENHVALWQGWVDHYEQKMLVIPTWTPKWLVILRDRRPNTGPAFIARGSVHNVLQEVTNVFQTHLLKKPKAENQCPQCSTTNIIPDFVASFRCKHCRQELVVPALLQMALYESSSPPVQDQPPDTPQPTIQLALQASHQIDARPMEESNWESAKGALFQGAVSKALCHSVKSTRTFGLSVKFTAGPAVGTEFCFRVSSLEDRGRLLHILQNPVLGARGVVAAETHAMLMPPPVLQGVVVATPAPQGEVAPWSCFTCTYEHKGLEALLSSCAMCDQPRPGAPLLPEPSAPPGTGEDPSGKLSQPVRAEEQALCQAAHADAPVFSGASGSAADIAGAVASAPKATDAEAPGASGDAPDVAGQGAASAPKDEDLCTVCMERRADAAVIPCGHLCGCHSCLTAVAGSSSPLCPLCRGPLSAVQRIYKS